MKTKIYHYIPLAIATILVLTHIIQTMLRPSYVDDQGYTVTPVIVGTFFITAIGLAICIGLIIRKSNLWKYVFLIIAILGVFRILTFSNSFFVSSIGFQELSISFELTSSFLLFFHVIFNPEITSKIRSAVRSNQATPIQQKGTEIKISKNRVDQFVKKFESKTEFDLRAIVESEHYTLEAKEAAKNILSSKFSSDI